MDRFEGKCVACNALKDGDTGRAFAAGLATGAVTVISAVRLNFDPGDASAVFTDSMCEEHALFFAGVFGAAQEVYRIVEARDGDAAKRETH